ncbi:28S ribosomal protein S35, mitochondrial [Agrilus planipennis]|uniref:28S ribosomal protein S35, mitochondrial n=1 Tax=Agrilus planipennis TaxID=224129 RepID=A0A1W4XBB6_AGRPL|nr:28S ribosomal protein S35, mitochondrial [Agrilus planipennis]
MALNLMKNSIKMNTFSKLQVRSSSGSSEPQFRVLNLKVTKSKPAPRRQPKKFDTAPPRAHQMPTDQNWGNVWPGPRSFHPATVPLPVRQGYGEKQAPPSKYANAELMKIPNFLHLTPPVIKRQCDALRKFCTPWPKELSTDENCEKHFPLETTTSSYCYSSPSIRNSLARIVTLRIKLSHLPLDQHAKDKFRRLVGDRYDENTDYVTIVADRCPTSKQNFDYCMYLLTAVFHESWNVEPWESKKTLEDMEYYDWTKNQSCKSLESMFEVPFDKIEHGKEFSEAVSNLMNNGENLQTLKTYGDTVRKLLGLSKEI